MTIRLTVLDDPAAMARATEAVQVSAAMPHDRRAHYIVAAALGERAVWAGEMAAPFEADRQETAAPLGEIQSREREAPRTNRPGATGSEGP